MIFFSYLGELSGFTKYLDSGEIDKPICKTKPERLFCFVCSLRVECDIKYFFFVSRSKPLVLLVTIITGTDRLLRNRKNSSNGFYLSCRNNCKTFADC